MLCLPHFLIVDLSIQIMMQYYYSSRARRGFEYHMSTRYYLLVFSIYDS